MSIATLLIFNSRSNINSKRIDSTINCNIIRSNSLYNSSSSLIYYNSIKISSCSDSNSIYINNNNNNNNHNHNNNNHNNNNNSNSSSNFNRNTTNINI